MTLTTYSAISEAIEPKPSPCSSKPLVWVLRLAMSISNVIAALDARQDGETFPFPTILDRLSLVVKAVTKWWTVDDICSVVSLAFNETNAYELTNSQATRVATMINSMWRQYPVNARGRSRQGVLDSFLSGDHWLVEEISLSQLNTGRSSNGMVDKGNVQSDGGSSKTESLRRSNGLDTCAIIDVDAAVKDKATKGEAVVSLQTGLHSSHASGRLSPPRKRLRVGDTNESAVPSAYMNSTDVAGSTEVDSAGAPLCMDVDVKVETVPFKTGSASSPNTLSRAGKSHDECCGGSKRGQYGEDLGKGERSLGAPFRASSMVQERISELLEKVLSFDVIGSCILSHLSLVDVHNMRCACVGAGCVATHQILHEEMLKRVKALQNATDLMNGVSFSKLFKKQVRVLPGSWVSSAKRVNWLRSASLEEVRRVSGHMQKMWPPTPTELANIKSFADRLMSPGQNFRSIAVNMPALRELRLTCPIENGCMKHIPADLGLCRQLRKLTMRHCSLPRTFPESVLQLSKLELLDFWDSFLTLISLPSDMGRRLRNLRYVVFRECTRLKSVPVSLMDTLENNFSHCGKQGILVMTKGRGRNLNQTYWKQLMSKQAHPKLYQFAQENGVYMTKRDAQAQKTASSAK